MEKGTAQLGRRPAIIGVMGPGESATADDTQRAYEIGRLIAGEGWVLLTGGRNAGVMAAASRGAQSANGLTIGILPGENTEGAAPDLDISIPTGMGQARNAINVLSSDAVVACGLGLGTLSEIALALKAEKPVVLLNKDPAAADLFARYSSTPPATVDSAAAAVSALKSALARSKTS